MTPPTDQIDADILASSASPAFPVAAIAELPPTVESGVLMTYRAAGLGTYGAVLRYVGMPLEKIALFLNSSQVSPGRNQLRQAVRLTFTDHCLHTGNKISFAAPYRVVGQASIAAWFLQYSVMGFVFQACDSALSNALGSPRMPYGAQLMEDPKESEDVIITADAYVDAPHEKSSSSKSCGCASAILVKAALAPAMAGAIESIVANRAEVQRFYGIERFGRMEHRLGWNAISRLCAPAFVANASRNGIMSATSFVLTPVLYRQYCPQEKKSQTSLFWFGLGMNVFVGNTVAITQQALWGRALDYAAADGGARNVSYRAVIVEGFKKEGLSAFFTVPKWASRVLMNAPAQGTLPWFYNEVLPLAEGSVLLAFKRVYGSVQLRGLSPGLVRSDSDKVQLES